MGRAHQGIFSGLWAASAGLVTADVVVERDQRNGELREKAGEGIIYSASIHSI